MQVLKLCKLANLARPTLLFKMLLLMLCVFREIKYSVIKHYMQMLHFIILNHLQQIINEKNIKFNISKSSNDVI